jgi:hypothetical protein
MWYLALVLLCLLSAGGGFYAGINMAYNNMSAIPWLAYRWDKEIFGFRPINDKTIIMANERVVMGFQIDTSGVPPEGQILSEIVSSLDTSKYLDEE